MFQQGDSILLSNSTDTSSGGLPADTINLHSLTDSLPIEYSVTAADIFGPDSILHYSSANAAPDTLSITSNFPYHIVLLALLVFYVLFVSIYFGEAGQLFRMVVASKREEYAALDDHGLLFARFMNLLATAGFITIGVALVKIIELYVNNGVVEAIPRYGPILIVGGTAVIIGLVSLFQRLIIRLSGAITAQSTTARRILSLRRLFFLVMTLCTVPLVLIFAIAPASWAAPLIGLFFAVSVLWVIYFVYRSLILFMQEKISILLWFLYLCVVEAMPLCLIALTIYRSVQV